MKLDCGPTAEEKLEAKEFRLKNWHKFFALIPRRIGESHECRWLEFIERKGQYVCGYGGCWWEWEYRVRE